MKGKGSISTLKLSDLLTEDVIVVKTSSSDWKDAIRKSGKLPENIDAVEPRYIDAMINFLRTV